MISIIRIRFPRVGVFADCRSRRYFTYYYYTGFMEGIHSLIQRDFDSVSGPKVFKIRGKNVLSGKDMQEVG